MSAPPGTRSCRASKFCTETVHQDGSRTDRQVSAFTFLVETAAARSHSSGLPKLFSMQSPSEWRKSSTKDAHHRQPTNPSLDMSPRSSVSFTVYDNPDHPRDVNQPWKGVNVRRDNQSIRNADAVQDLPDCSQYFADAVQAVNNFSLQMEQQVKQVDDAAESMFSLLKKLSAVLSHCQQTNSWHDHDPPVPVLEAIRYLGEKHQKHAKLSGSAVDWMLDLCRTLLEWYEENDPQGFGNASQVVGEVEGSLKRLATMERDLYYLWDRSEVNRRH
ncbi:hypothetical protein CALVIDRAFT_560401 [Calocera viscosa TUFC12733]|uniref:Uncharacterized protein n=1 Tax=Calocera viscosa (strain TUFC12733) TaxID=1330018 RepID=A0A167R040_CALVF|nr:hypothetical protein CALVIDRAFT_560401 [Calocera viscosa TUFC12733]